MTAPETTPSLTAALFGMVDDKVTALNVALPGRVESYDPAQARVSVKPLIKRRVEGADGSTLVESLAIVDSVPLVFPGMGSYRITFPVSVGDTVLLVFASASLDLWLVDGREVDPLDARSSALSDAVAIPGLVDFKSADEGSPASSDAMVIETPELRLGSDAASDGVIKGTARDVAEQTFLTALDLAYAATLAPGPAKATFSAAVTAFKSAVTAAVSSKVKAE